MENLLSAEELQADVPDVTRQVMHDAKEILETEPDQTTLDDVAPWIEYLGDQVVSLRADFDRLYREVLTIKKEITKKNDTQKKLFE